MPPPKRTVSPGVACLIPPKLQEILWALHQEQPLLPSIFDLRKGQGRYTQHIDHLCLLPYYDQHHTVEVEKPLDDIRITILPVETGLLMRLSNKALEAGQTQKPAAPEQGELF